MLRVDYFYKLVVLVPWGACRHVNRSIANTCIRILSLSAVRALAFPTSKATQRREMAAKSCWVPSTPAAG